MTLTCNNADFRWGSIKRICGDLDRVKGAKTFVEAALDWTLCRADREAWRIKGVGIVLFVVVRIVGNEKVDFLMTTSGSRVSTLFISDRT
jgi:hypothetical protein